MNQEKKLKEILEKLENVVLELSQICGVNGNNKECSDTEIVEKVDLETIRACLAELLHDGKREKIVELLSKYGASCLSDVKAEDYSSLLKDAEELKNG